MAFAVFSRIENTYITKTFLKSYQLYVISNVLLVFWGRLLPNKDNLGQFWEFCMFWRLTFLGH